jgi:hypothetical protein
MRWVSEGGRVSTGILKQYPKVRCVSERGRVNWSIEKFPKSEVGERWWKRVYWEIVITSGKAEMGERRREQIERFMEFSAKPGARGVPKIKNNVVFIIL